MIQLSTHEFSDSPFNKTRAAPGQALVSKPPFGPKTRGADRGLGPLWHPSPWHHLKSQALALSAFRSSLSSFNCHLSIVKNAQKSLKSPSFPTWMFHHEHMAYSENRAYMGIPWYTVYPLNPSKSTGSSSFLHRFSLQNWPSQLGPQLLQLLQGRSRLIDLLQAGEQLPVLKLRIILVFDDSTMAIEIVDVPIENGGSFHSYVWIYQRVSQCIP